MTPRARARVWPRPPEAAACHWAARSRRRASAAGWCLWGAGSRYLGAAPAGSRRRRPRAGRRARRALCREVVRMLGRGLGGWPRAGGRARSAGGGHVEGLGVLRLGAALRSRRVSRGPPRAFCHGAPRGSRRPFPRRHPGVGVLLHVRRPRPGAPAVERAGELAFRREGLNESKRWP